MSKYYQFYNEQTKHWVRIDLHRDKIKVRDLRWWRIKEIKLPTGFDTLTGLIIPIIGVASILQVLCSMTSYDRARKPKEGENGAA